jgi:hypothetical protein
MAFANDQDAVAAFQPRSASSEHITSGGTFHAPLR